MNNKLDVVAASHLEGTLSSLTTAHNRLKRIIALSKSEKIKDFAGTALAEVDSVGAFLVSLGRQNNCSSGVRLWENKDSN